MSKKTFALIILVLLIAIGGVYYWFFLRNLSPGVDTSVSNNQNTSTIFGTRQVTTTTGTPGHSAATTSSSQNTAVAPIAVLRELSATPVGGMAASTTASSTIVRWIDRGVGRVYQAFSNSNNILELSNTTIPAVYNTFWDKNTDAFVLQTLNDDSDTVTSIYATLFPLYTAHSTGSSTATTSISIPSAANTTPFELRGAQLPSNILNLAVSPEGNKIFALQADESTGDTIGYISQFDGSKKTEIFDTPLTMLNIEWPTDSTIAITTKGSSNSAGFLYFVDPKKGIFNKILGNVRGLSTLISKDATKVLYNATINNGVQTAIYDIKAGSSQNVIFNTMPEKCLWSTLQPDTLYCAVPAQIPAANYPEDWYKGNVSFSDSIWEVDAVTGSAHIIANLSQSGSSIDAFNLTLDPKENYLYFMNKKDLSLWSLQLNN